MLNNQEFIKEVYKKYDEYKQEKKVKKYTKTKKFVSMAAVCLIACTIILGTNQKRPILVEPKTQENIDNESKISLATIENFGNFYNIIKEAYKNSEESIEREELKENINDTAKVENSIAKDYSNTNIQVENVDEADIVKTDENYIYYVINDKIIIVDIRGKLEKISEIDLSKDDFKPEEIYIYKNKLIAVGNENSYSTSNMRIVCETTDVAYVSSDSKRKTGVIIYDLSNISEPKESRRVEVDGNYISSRMIGNNIYFASNKYQYFNNMVKKEIQDLKEDDFKPKYIDTCISQEEKYINFNDIYYFNEMENTNYLILVGLNIESTEEANIETFLGAGEKIYSSEKNMYIAKTKSIYDINTGYTLGENTQIIKFELNSGKIQYKAETTIAGRINNQFSMDEKDKYFRIATTVGNFWEMNENTSNSLYILDENLKEVGKIEGLAKEERIYSVRYIGNLAYVVTFKQVDPLFVIDLSNPQEPKVLGELKLPGYSTYLHPYDETHLIGFGYETKENGTRVTTDGLKMVMFDISDLNNPKVLFKVNIGSKYTNSSLLETHKALLFSKEKNIIAFPTDVYTKGKYMSQALVYEIDMENGFNLKCEIQKAGATYENKIERIIYNKNNYYVLSQNQIKAVDMESLQEVAILEI